MYVVEEFEKETSGYFSRSFAIEGHRERRQLLEKIVVSRDTFILR